MKCKVDFCNSKPNISGKGYCRRHYDQIRKYGHVDNIRTQNNPNEFVIKNNNIEIVLRDKYSNEIGRAIVDIDDYEKVLKYKWSLHNKGYVRTFIKTKPLYLHRYLLELSDDDLEVDHINANKLDNRKSNLRKCEHWLNCANRGKSRERVLGICDTKRNLTKPIAVKIKRNKICYNLGYFETIEEAVNARLKAENELDFAYGV